MTTLIAYCRLALFEQQLSRGKVLSRVEAAQLVESWEAIYRHPKRYIGQVEAQQIGAQLAVGRAPVTHVLQNVVIADKPHIQQRLTELATLLQWLSGAFVEGRDAKSAHATLMELEKRLGYCDYLEKRGTISEAGVDEAENVKQFIEEAKGHGTLKAYLVHLKQLAEQQAAQQKAAGRNLITLRTMHSAKGLEWPVVILPSSHEGNVPHRKSDNVEEERRLLYVALTRSKRDLHIYHLNKEPTSFLAQAKWQSVLAAVAHLRAALGKPSATWSAAEWQAIAATMQAPYLGLMEYLQQGHPWGSGEWKAITQHLATMAKERKEAKPSSPPSKVTATSPKPIFAAPRAKSPMPAASRTGHARTGHAWQAFDVVHHPQHGQGIVISTTTTSRGRELKVQFANGSLHHFRDDDGELVKG